MGGCIISSPSGMMKYTRTAPPSTGACDTNSSPSNWRLGIDVSKIQARWISLKAINANFPSNSACQTPTLSLNSVCKKKKKNNMHVFIHRKRNRLAGTLTYKEPYFTHKDFSLIWQLEIIPPPPPPPLSRPLPPSLPDLLIADWERQAVQEPFNLALDWEKAENVFSSLCFMTHEQCRMVGGNCIDNVGQTDIS